MTAKIHLSPGGAFFSADHDESAAAAYRVARAMSRKGKCVEMMLRGSSWGGDGIVGQYIDGKVTSEFRAHDRAAGLRSQVYTGA